MTSFEQWMAETGRDENTYRKQIDKMKAQKDEFDALTILVKAFKNLPAVVDDDYPEMRHRYESELKTFLEACKNNGRI